MGKRVALLAVVLVVAGVATLALLGPGTAPDGPAAEAPEPAGSEAAAARLAGRATQAVPADAVEPAAPLIQAFQGEDPAIRVDATNRLRARLKKGDLTLDELLSIALVPPCEGPAGLLRERALGSLTEQRRAALLLLPRLLDLLEAGEEHEPGVAAEVIRALSGGFGSLYLMALADDPADRPAPEELLPFLPRIEALVRDEDRRMAVLPLLHALGGEGASAASALVAWIQEIEKGREEFRRENPNIHVSWAHHEYTIADVLANMGAAALPAILAALDEEDPYGEYSLHMAIREMGGEAQDALKELLAHDDPEIRAEALVAVASNAEGEPATLEILRQALRDPAAEVREAAVPRLETYGAEVGPDLLAALSDPEDDVREAAARALAEVPEAAASALPTLLAMLESGSYGEQLSTLRTLQKLGPAAAEGTPAVLALLADNLESEHLRDMFSDTFLITLKAFGEGAVPTLLQAAGGEDPKLRHAAVETLLQLEGVHGEDLAPLAGGLATLEGADRMRLASLLAARDHPAGTRTLVAGLSSENREARTAAAEGLQHAGADAIGALPLLIQGLRENHAKLHADGANWSREWDHYYAFHLAVIRIGSHAPAELLSALADENEHVAEAAAKGLAQAGDPGLVVLDAHWDGIPPGGRVLLVGSLAAQAFGEVPSERARGLLERAFADPAPRVRLTAARAASKSPLFFPCSVETYIGLLAAPDGDVAQDAAYRLRKLGGKLAPWEEALRAAQPKEESTARKWVQDALDRIEDAR